MKLRFSKNILISAICVLLTACTSFERDNRRAEIYTRLGYEYLNNGKYPEALQNFLEAESLDDSASSIQNGLAMTYFAREKYDLATTHINKAIQLDSKNIDAHNNKGRILIALGKYDEAEKSLETALKDLTYTELEKPLTNMGLLLMRRNQPEQAKTYFMKAIQANRNFCPAYKEYGNALIKIKNYEVAGPLFDKAIKVCQNSPEEVHYLSALSYYQLGKKDFAVARLREVIKLYPESEYAEKSKSLLKAVGYTGDQFKEQDQK